MIEQDSKIIESTAKIAMMMAILTLISKCFGFVRETVMANFFGAGYITDSYVMAQSIPGILTGGIFAAVSTTFIPLFSQTIKKAGNREGDLFTSRVINLLIVFSIVASVIGLLFSRQLVELLANGFDQQRIELTSTFLKITFIYTLFSSTASIIDAYLQYKGFFLTQILAGYALNIMAISTIIFSKYTSYYYLAFGILLGQAVRFTIVFLKARKIGFKYHISFRTTDVVNKIIVLAVPVFISSYVYQINTFIDKALASQLKLGSVSALYYSMLLVTLITGLSASIISTIFYPKIAQASTNNDISKLSQISSKGVNLILIVTIPFSLGIVFYGTQVVKLVYERGAFDSTATGLTASAFTFYGLGMCFLALNELLMRVYYSMHDMKTPMIFAGISTVVNIVLCLILVRFMQHNGLALATSIAFSVNTLLLIFGARKKYPNIYFIESKFKIIKIVIAAVLAISGSLFVKELFADCSNRGTIIEIIQLFVCFLFACIIYIIILYSLKIDEIKAIRSLFK
ncbi:murein biosynthesis integral membrane protein MurJ [Clostridium aminobutyricum]|uniref:Probable lipid II flippase MurJ n=1 Tax=Clostridium aminobutyricum TaxID=33953 RepID=A0A939D9W3_CLOAM|nr:murein biosynthesis integral membrane protein MurJ [Clostridium aminobutyricum]MBN7774079.1 murein biosynthesis integral membrane protein MurJ [Clostridium aminobutyricum]